MPYQTKYYQTTTDVIANADWVIVPNGIVQKSVMSQRTREDKRHAVPILTLSQWQARSGTTPIPRATHRLLMAKSRPADPRFSAFFHSQSGTKHVFDLFEQWQTNHLKPSDVKTQLDALTPAWQYILLWYEQYQTHQRLLENTPTDASTPPDLTGQTVVLVGFSEGETRTQTLVSELSNQKATVVVALPDFTQATLTQYVHAPTIADEIKAVTQMIYTRVQSGASLDEFMVVVPSWKDYESGLKKELIAHGLVGTGFPAKPVAYTPIGQFMVRALDLVLMEMNRESLLAFFSSPWINQWYHPDGIIQLDRGLMMTQLTQLPNPSGYLKWLELWDQQGELNEAASQHRELLSYLSQKVSAVIQLSQANDFTKWARDFLTMFNFPNQLIKTATADDIYTYHQLLELLEQFGQFYPKINTEISGINLVSDFKQFLLAAQFEPLRTDGILICHKAAGIGIQKNYHYVLGALEYHWQDQGSQEVLDADRLTYYRTHALKASVVTHAQSDEAGRSQIPTYLIDLRAWQAYYYDGPATQEEWQIAHPKSDSPKFPDFPIQTELPVLSVSQLELYQRCPHAYFHKYILKIPETPDDSLRQKAQWGILLHQILDAFFTALSDQNQLQLFHGNPLQFQPLLQSVCQKSIAAKPLSAFQKKLYLQKLIGDAPLGILRQFLGIYRSETTLIPSQFEHPFECDIDGMRLRGKIDMVLRDTANHYVGVVDYKTGSLPEIADIRTHKSLQLPIYLLALQQENPAAQVAVGMLYQLSESSSAAVRFGLIGQGIPKSVLDPAPKRPAKFDDAFKESLSTHLSQLKTRLLSADFAPAPESTRACLHCSYKLSCRYQNRF